MTDDAAGLRAEIAKMHELLTVERVERAAATALLADVRADMKVMSVAITELQRQAAMGRGALGALLTVAGLIGGLAGWFSHGWKASGGGP